MRPTKLILLAVSAAALLLLPRRSSPKTPKTSPSPTKEQLSNTPSNTPNLDISNQDTLNQNTSTTQD